MTRKKDKIKLYQLNAIKKRRMQKFHARKIIRFYRHYEINQIWIASLKMFISAKDVRLDPVLKKYMKSYKIKFTLINK